MTILTHQMILSGNMRNKIWACTLHSDHSARSVIVYAALISTCKLFSTHLMTLSAYLFIQLPRSLSVLQSNNLLHNEDWLSGKFGHFSEYISVICYKVTIYYTMRTDYLVSLDIFLNTSQWYVTKWQSTKQWGLIKLGHFSEYISVICYKATIYYTMRTDYLVSLDIFLNTSQWYVTKQQSTTQWELIIW